MFTIEQIKVTHAKVTSGADFPKYVQEIKALGVIYYDVFVEDGRSKYYGADNFTISDGATYATKTVADVGSTEKLKDTISIHQQGETDYLTFCQQAAEAGVEKWTTHMLDMEVVYYDKQENKLLVEPIPQQAGNYV